MRDRRDWPQEVGKAKVFGNFRIPLWFREAKRQTWRDKRPGMSPAHLAAIRQLTCTVCFWRADTEAHHLKSGPARFERGVSFKATDRWCVPLCAKHHTEVEAIGSRREFDWFQSYGINPHALAQGLWNQRADVAGMRRVLDAHKRDAICTLRARR